MSSAPRSPSRCWKPAASNGQEEIASIIMNYPRRTLAVFLVISVFCPFTSPAYAGDWTQFRGPNGSGVADETDVPVRWSADQNVLWKADLPGRGLSSPIIAGDRVFVTAATGYLQKRLV